MKRKLITIVALLGLMLSSASLWAYSVPTIGDMINADKAKISALQVSIADAKASYGDLQNQKSDLASKLADDDTAMSNAKQTVIDENAAILTDKGHVLKVQAHIQAVKDANAAFRAALADKMALTQQYQLLLDQIATAVTSVTGYQNQLPDIVADLQYLQAESAKCGFNSISLC